jgi:hypothetical protein
MLCVATNLSVGSIPSNLDGFDDVTLYFGILSTCLRHPAIPMAFVAPPRGRCCRCVVQIAPGSAERTSGYLKRPQGIAGPSGCRFVASQTRQGWSIDQDSARPPLAPSGKWERQGRFGPTPDLPAATSPSSSGPSDRMGTLKSIGAPGGRHRSDDGP